jgi:hypothetical protein
MQLDQRDIGASNKQLCRSTTSRVHRPHRFPQRTYPAQLTAALDLSSEWMHVNPSNESEPQRATYFS